MQTHLRVLQVECDDVVRQSFRTTQGAIFLQEHISQRNSHRELGRPIAATWFQSTWEPEYEAR